MTKTENLGLNLFEGTDKVSMTKLNENAKLLDAAMQGTSASGHKHAASDITSGTLPVERGGTGASDAATARTNLGAAHATTYTATVPTTWTASGNFYYQDIAVSGILASDNPIVDISPGSDNDANLTYSENMCKVFRITTSANSIRVWATEAIASSFPIQLKVVR